MKKVENKALPILGWAGGKSRLAKTIVNIINQVEHTCYAEPFIGMGGIFLRRDMRPKSEIINDYNHDVVNLFRVVQKHPDELCRHLRFQLTSRNEFFRQRKLNPDLLTDIERAARFVYLQRITFGGRVNSYSYGIITTGKAGFNTDNILPAIERLHQRLSHVQVECDDWKDFIKRVDRPHVLFYLDPPYYGFENDYGKDLFDRKQFAIMADLLSGIKGKFILSINKLPEIQSLFKDYNIKIVDTLYMAQADKPKKVQELIITNFEYEER